MANETLIIDVIRQNLDISRHTIITDALLRSFYSLPVITDVKKPVDLEPWFQINEILQEYGWNER